MTKTAQHGRLKNGQQQPLTTGTAGQPQSRWSESKAQQLAAQAGTQLSEAHWEVIRYVRDYYLWTAASYAGPGNCPAP